MSSYCGLVDAKIRASDKDLPVQNGVVSMISKPIQSILMMTRMLQRRDLINSHLLYLGKRAEGKLTYYRFRYKNVNCCKFFREIATATIFSVKLLRY